LSLVDVPLSRAVTGVCCRHFIAIECLQLHKAKEKPTAEPTDGGSTAQYKKRHMNKGLQQHGFRFTVT